MEAHESNPVNTSKPTLTLSTVNEPTAHANKTPEEFRNFLLQCRPAWLDEILMGLTTTNAGKKSFLVYKCKKYFNIPTKNIALFYIRRESVMLICFDKQGYLVNYSLEQIQSLLPEKQFYRLNRQYLINFNAVKDVEHYLSRKLLVNPVIPTEEKLIVSKEKVSDFLHWLDNR